MLRDEIAKYTELTGEDGLHTPIIKIGAYLDGYDKGLEVLNKIIADLETNEENTKNDIPFGQGKLVGLHIAIEIVKKYQEVS